MLQASTSSKFFCGTKATDFILKAVNITKVTGYLDTISCSLIIQMFRMNALPPSSGEKSEEEVAGSSKTSANT
jgi:hypothetical protein